MKRVLTLAAMMFLLTPLAAQAFSLGWPVACQLGSDCHIQNFVDHDPSPTMRDFACGSATYNGHEGVDIRLRNLAAMRAGVAVLAAADGVVEGTRDGMDDRSIREHGKASVQDRECGNGVAITHAQGYRTQYCHMMKGSTRVRTGQQVKAGDAIGNIGLSGQTEFPHLHLSVWKDGVKLDPFTAAPITNACSATPPASSLWAQPVAYQPTALLADGFASAPLDAKTMEDNPPALTHLASNAPALVYWVSLINPQAGDVLALRISAPGGGVFVEKAHRFEKHKATFTSFVGKKNSSGQLAPGLYRAEISLTRTGASAPIIRKQLDMVVER